MLSAFKAKFGDKWNEDWTVCELRSFCDEFVETMGGSAVARYIEYGAIVDAFIDDGYTVWKFVETETDHTFEGQDTYTETSYDIVCRDRRYNRKGEPEWRCHTDGLWVITNADTDLLEEAEAE